MYLGCRIRSEGVDSMSRIATKKKKKMCPSGVNLWRVKIDKIWCKICQETLNLNCQNVIQTHPIYMARRTEGSETGLLQAQLQTVVDHFCHHTSDWSLSQHTEPTIWPLPHIHRQASLTILYQYKYPKDFTKAMHHGNKPDCTIKQFQKVRQQPNHTQDIYLISP